MANWNPGDRNDRPTAQPNGPADVAAGQIHDHWHAPRDYGEQAAAAGRTGARDAWPGAAPSGRPTHDPFAPNRYRYDMRAPANVLHDGEQLIGGRAALHQPRGPKNYRRSDDRIREDICEALIAATHLDASDATVDVSDGVVTLQGVVPERRMKHAIEDITAAVAGVREVENRIRVVPGGADPLLER